MDAVPLKKRGRKPGGEKFGGRQKGTPNRWSAQAKDLAGKHGAKAIKELVRILKDGDNDAVKVSAAKELLNRAYGMAPHAPNDPGGQENPIRHVFRWATDAE